MLQLESCKPPKAMMPVRAGARLSGEVFGSLINLSGRRRFTSQRLILYALLASLGHEGAMQTAEEALKLFSDAHRALVEGNATLPGVFCESLQTAYFGPLQEDQKIRDFIALAAQTLDAIKTGTRAAPTLLDALVKSATPLLAILNQLTSIYEQEAGNNALALQKQRVNMLTEIERIGRQARMVCFNAQIVAARAGVVGREFSVVAGELTSVTRELDALVHAALESSIG